MTLPGFPRPSNLRGEGNLRGPTERHVRVLQNAIQKLQDEVREISTGYRFGGTVYFTSSGTFNKADYPGLRAVMVEVQGAGAGGSGSGTGGGTGSSGGGGGYARSFVLVDDLADSEAVTIGAAGTAGSAGDNVGGAGGDSVFDTISGEVRGEGGDPGQIQASGNRLGGLGGGGTGDLVIPGGPGNGAQGATRGLGKGGGDSVFGHGGLPSGVAANFASGHDGRGYGGGGSGANTNSTHTAAGGSGAPGIVIVHLYY